MNVTAKARIPQKSTLTIFQSFAVPADNAMQQWGRSGKIFSMAAL